ncbi:TolC family protein [Szabonella alba]|uniref:TolC family protein n=1 Tax=Szabonella alba TaxID=2804194 RepID=A0A8K0VE03_9RHOB|nr:TolC family protein [Szabonella alba]MBL4919371.1 TolC family protein [Szabonella alba]
MIRQGRSSRRLIAATGLLALGLVAGCGGLRDADGTEAAIAEQAATMPGLTRGEGQDIGSVARNGLLMSPSVRESASAVSASADEVRVSRAALFPSLGLSLGAGTGDAGRGDPSLELEGNQLLLDFGDTKRAVTVADLELQINYITFQKSVDDALVEVARAYDAVAVQADLLKVRRTQLAAMRELETLVAERAASGATASPDLLEARKRLQAAEFLVHDTELALAEARDRLTRLGGQARGGEVRIPPGACAARDDSDAMRIARLRLVQSELKLERAERAQLPRILLSPVARSQSGDDGVRLGLNLGVDSDLLQGGALTARANAARNSVGGARAGLEATKLDADLEARKLQRDIAAGNRRIEMLNRQIALLGETRSLYRSQYLDLGTRQLPDLLDNEEEYHNRRAERIEARSAILASRLQCAVLERSLRQTLGVSGNSLYGFPLAPDAL